MLRYHRTESGRSIAAGWAFASVDPRRARSLQFAILLLAMLVLPVRPLGAAARATPTPPPGPLSSPSRPPTAARSAPSWSSRRTSRRSGPPFAGDGYAGNPNGTLAYGDGGINAPRVAHAGNNLGGRHHRTLRRDRLDGRRGPDLLGRNGRPILPVVCHCRRRRAREPARRRRGAGQRRRRTRHRRRRRRWSGQRIRRRRARRRDRHRRRCCGCRRYRRHRRGRRRRASKHRCRHGADWLWWRPLVAAVSGILA